MFRKMYLILLLVVFISGSNALGQTTLQPVSENTLPAELVPSESQKIVLSGRLWERGTKRPLEGINLFLLPQKIKATSDKDGRFQFTTAGAAAASVTGSGASELVVNASGYLRLSRALDLSKPVEGVDVYLERESYLGSFETKVVAQDTKKDGSSRSLDFDRFSKAVGGLGDPLRAVQDLPGVNRPTAGSANILIQGSGPNDTKYLIEGHEIPLMFHFGGISSVVFPEAAERIELLAAGYGPEYGRALGGLVGAWTRAPDSPRLKGQAYTDLFNAGGYLEGKIGDSTQFFLSLRRSYIGEVLSIVAKDNPAFNFVAAPNFGDVTGIVSHKIDERQDFKLTTLASQDSLQFVLSQPVDQDPSVRGSLSNQISFYRVIPKWEFRRNADSLIWASTSFGQDNVSFDSDDNFIRQKSQNWSLRSEWQERWTSLWKTTLGIDNSYAWYDYDVQLPNRFSLGGITTPNLNSRAERSTRTAKGINAGLYLRNELRSEGSPWTFYPNMRLDYLGLVKQWLPAPRFNVRYDVDTSFHIRAGTGLYYQSPSIREIDPVFGNPDVLAPRSIHGVLGAEKDFREGAQTGFVISTDLFYRHLDSQVIPSQGVVERNGAVVPQFFSNDGTGRVYGLQTQLKYNTFPWNFELAYTLSRSFRSTPSQGEFPFQFDQTHLVGFFGSREFERNWRAAWRLRFATGNPFTPVTGAVFDSDSDLYLPTRGAFFSDRLDPFFQLDLRVDKKWIYDTWVLSVYLDILNVANTKNSEGTRYSYDYSQKEVVQGLPILPALGMKGEF